MNLSSDARKLRKQQQLDRLAAKAEAADSGDYAAYSEFYAGQSLQKAKAELNAKITAARQLLRKVNDELDVARVSGVNIQAAHAAVSTAAATVAALEAEKQTVFGRQSGASISA